MKMTLEYTSQAGLAGSLMVPVGERKKIEGLYVNSLDLLGYFKMYLFFESKHSVSG